MVCQSQMIVIAGFVRRERGRAFEIAELLFGRGGRRNGAAKVRFGERGDQLRMMASGALPQPDRFAQLSGVERAAAAVTRRVGRNRLARRVPRPREVGRLFMPASAFAHVKNNYTTIHRGAQSRPREWGRSRMI